MRIVILGSGLMGPAVAYSALTSGDVSGVTIVDLSNEQLATVQAKLAPLPGGDRVEARQLDLSAQCREAVAVARAHDVIVAALPRPVIPLGIRTAILADRPLIDLNWPLQDSVPALQEEVAASGILYIPGCGLEPGLTEIWTRHLAERLDRVTQVHIKCGGIPENPSPPLGYKIVFGGRQLPLREEDATTVKDGSLVHVPRYSGVEQVRFHQVGEVEAWHEGFVPWLMELDALCDLRIGTQKTLRWPGYARKATVLKDLGLLSNVPISLNGVEIAPKDFLDSLLYPKVRMGSEERDLTVFRVDVIGDKAGQPWREQVEMVDHYDERLGFTSMARTTGFTAGITARMVAQGDLTAEGWQTPERLLVGPTFRQLITELDAFGVSFETQGEAQ